MKLYRLRYERWKLGIGVRRGSFRPFMREFKAPTRKAALKEASKAWAEIIEDSVSTRFVELIEIVDWAPSP